MNGSNGVATVAQLVEHRICNAAVAGSNPVCGSCTEYSSIGRAFALGAKGCTFKSCYSDSMYVRKVK